MLRKITFWSRSLYNGISNPVKVDIAKLAEATKSAAGLDLSKLEVGAPFHDFPWMGRDFA
jgi:hypothetical protein